MLTYIRSHLALVKLYTDIIYLRHDKTGVWNKIRLEFEF